MPPEPDDRVRRAHGFHPLRVQQVVAETPDAASFVLEIPDDVRDLYGYRAGQFCTFRVHVDGGEQLRCYSMSSAPEVDAELTVTVKRVPNGLVSNWLLDHVQAGDVLEATKPAGAFVLGERDRPVVGFCGGSGVTPVISIAKSALAAGGRPVRLLYANRDRASVIFDRRLDELVAEHPERLEVRHHLDADAGLLDATAIETFVGDTRDADFYLCGPGPFMDLVERTLLGLGVGVERIHIERFVEPADTVAGTDDTGDAMATPGSDGDVDVPDEITIILKGRRNTVAYRAGDTILQTARRGNLQAPFSCEAGECATCMAMLHDGDVTMRTNNALTDDELEEGWILTCQSVPTTSTITVEYESF